MARGKEIFDIVIEGGIILTMVDGEEPVHDGRVVISGDKIVEVSARQGSPPPEAKVIINAGDTIILPGLINAHGHSPMTIFRGLADDLPLKSWLFDYIFPAEAKHVNPDTVYWGSLLGCLEMISSGTTTSVDGYFLADGIVKAVDKAGMRALVAQGVIDFPAPGVPDPEKNLDVGLGFLKRWIDFSDRIRPGLFCHSPLTCSDTTLRRAHEMSNGFGVPLQIHLSETRDEPEEIVKKTHLRPAFHLNELGLLGGTLIAAHAVHLNDEELELLAQREVKIAHCPESNMKLGSGISRVATMIGKGMTVGLGTDSCASNNNLDLLSEMDTAAKLAKVSSLDPTLLDAKTLVRMATMGGAQLIGLEHMIGSIEKGKKADIAIISTDAPHMTPMYNPYSQIVYSATGGDVRDVIIDGRIVYRNSRFTALDSDEIMNQVQGISQGIRSD
jgi:5-methylthioadenosine/S-adenosylhomocysteine deaminase